MENHYINFLNIKMPPNLQNSFSSSLKLNNCPNKKAAFQSPDPLTISILDVEIHLTNTLSQLKDKTEPIVVCIHISISKFR
jgi:hypothetical protein